VVTPPGTQGHGTSAKKKPGSSGFVSCRICHGNDFLGGSVQVACLNAGCHGGAGQSPHPAQWRTGDTYVHTTTDEANASVCAQCHLNGNNSPIGPPSPPAAAGTPPGCFNSTLCHGENPVPHPVGSSWVTTPPAAQPHGNSAKDPPGPSSGFAFCQGCHGTGTNFAGGSVEVSCYQCHGASAPHPGQWRTGDTYVHTTADPGNASVCGFCHLAGANSPIAPPSPPAAAGTPPGCFNNTLCHGENPVPHPVGSSWVTTPPTAQPHGNSAKAALSSSEGFAYCRVCHGTSNGNYNGGVAQVSCLNVACHGGTGNSPHASQWFQGDTYVHTTTGEGNASECAFCHFNEPNAGNHSPTPPPAGSNPGCFNGTLCHGSATSVHSAGWFVRPPGPQPHGQSAKLAPSSSSGFAYCRVCHGTSTGDYNGGFVQFSCLIVACHGGTGNSPHASQWLPGNTYSHTSTNTGNAPECAFCHFGESGGGNHPPTPPPGGSTPGCTNNTLCHGS
ncbi:MAG: hypothetical protein ACXWXD_08205, partial [Candidatus Deferrimicrobiaceae bacterium]